MEWLLELPVIPVFHLKTQVGYLVTLGRGLAFLGFIFDFGLEAREKSVTARRVWVHAGDEVFVYGYEAHCC